MKKFFYALLISLLLISTAVSAVACSKATSDSPVDPDPTSTIAKWQKTYTAGDFGIRNKKDPFVEFTFSTGESIRLELYPTVAPITVNNFVSYVEEGFYIGVAIHRTLEGQIFQCGGFEIIDDKLVQKATHDPIKGEFLANGVTNTLPHIRGVISMARLRDSMDSATSQFFICATTMSGWDGSYAAFGRVIDEESFTVVSRLSDLETGVADLYYGETPYSSSDVPTTRVTITKAVLVWDK